MRRLTFSTAHLFGRSPRAHAAPAGTLLSGQPMARPSSDRDLRIDLFRGLALIFIFIDHVPGNVLGLLTMRAMGLSDAAEVFVLLAGYSAVLAYSGRLQREGFWAGSRRVLRRVRDLYIAHVLLVAACVAFLAMVARYFENPLYYEHVNLTPFSFDPWGAIWRFVLLYYQLGYLNILPLYIVLLAWFPVLWWLLRRSAVLGLGFSAALWLIAGTFKLNLPSWPEVYGWFFNPFAWQLLFAIGASAAMQAQKGASLPRSPWLVALALVPLLIGFVVAAPWINIPMLDLPRLVAFDALGYVSKSNLSLWRLSHVLAAAYIVALLVPAGAAWLHNRRSTWIVNCGRNSLDIFCLGTLLSFLGMAVMLEVGREWPIQLAVNAVGIGVLLCTGTWLTRRKALRSVAKAGGAAARETFPDAGGAALK